MKRKRRKDHNEQEPDLKDDRNQEIIIKTSIIALLIFVFGLLSLLSLFSLSGSFGLFLDDILSLIFGWSKWLFPFLLIVLSIAIYKKNKFFSKKSNYFGLSLFFIFISSLLHFFYKNDIAKIKASEGLGGGYLGFYLSLFLENSLGFWGGLVVILAILALSLILLFNVTLSHLVGSKSFLFQIFRSISNFFKINDISEEDSYSTEDENQNNYEEEIKNEKNKDDNLAEDQDVLFVKKEIGFSNSRTEDLGKKEEVLRENVNWKTKKIKIDLPLELLSNKINKATSGDIDKNILIIQRTLENFGILVEMGGVNVGPTVTQYTFKPSEGIKVSKITALNNDLSLALAAHPIRIEAPIPGKSLIGIEVPNKTKAIVGLREVLEEKDFKNRQTNLMAALGKDVSGKNIVYDIAKMPHLLVAGATNSGKSVCLNTIIVSLLYQNNPDDLRFILVDPKRVELPTYNGIPHLLTPVITEVSKTINALRWCLNEMDRRYEMLNRAGKKNIQTYNQNGKEKIPYIIFVIDELADLMVSASKDIESSVIRLTQMSRAVGIHLILATQRPSVDVITGLIKANTPARIAFSVASAVDSKTILDSSGAEKLLGKGDMLFTTAELSKPKRIQGAYVSDEEISSIVSYIKEKYGTADYLEGITERQKVSGIGGVGLDGLMGDEDELLEEAKEIVLSSGKASTSFLQRRLRIGYSRAASILDMLEELGMVGPSNGSKPREIMVSKEQYENTLSNPFSSTPIHNRSASKSPNDYLYKEEESPLVFEELENDSEEDENNDEDENNIEEIENKDNSNDDIEDEKGEEDNSDNNNDVEFLEEDLNSEIEAGERSEDEEAEEGDNRIEISDDDSISGIEKDKKTKIDKEKNKNNQINNISDDDFGKYFSK